MVEQSRDHHADDGPTSPPRPNRLKKRLILSVLHNAELQVTALATLLLAG